MNEAKTLVVAESPTRSPVESLASRIGRALAEMPVVGRYVIVGGIIGVPASIGQLWLLILLYEHTAGSIGTLALNALWLLNFEIGLLRNFGLHCAFTWRTSPSWKRVRHAHVAASGALVIDLVAFNGVLFLTGFVPLAQLFGACSGFVFNYAYNSLKTFARSRDQAEGGIA